MSHKVYLVSQISGVVGEGDIIPEVFATPQVALTTIRDTYSQFDIYISDWDADGFAHSNRIGSRLSFELIEKEVLEVPVIV